MLFMICCQVVLLSMFSLPQIIIKLESYLSCEFDILMNAGVFFISRSHLYICVSFCVFTGGGEFILEPTDTYIYLLTYTYTYISSLVIPRTSPKVTLVTYTTVNPCLCAVEGSRYKGVM